MVKSLQSFGSSITIFESAGAVCTDAAAKAVKGRKTKAATARPMRQYAEVVRLEAAAKTLEDFPFLAKNLLIVAFL